MNETLSARPRRSRPSSRAITLTLGKRDRRSLIQ
jgi:hypothetical protein